MKPYDIYSYLDHFDKIMKDARWSLEGKLLMGNELLQSMPPASLVSSSKHTYNAVRHSIAAQLEVLADETKRVAEQKVEETTSQPEDKTSMDGGKQAPASDNKDEAGGRSKVGKTPKNAKGSRGKKPSAKGNT